MDFKTQILRWERAAQDNPAVIALIVVAVIALAFIIIVLVDAVLSKRKKNEQRKRLK